MNLTESFADAAAHAASKSIKGMPGHLMTFNHFDEYAFIRSVYSSPIGWVGVSDTQIEGTFTYFGGPESGQVVTNMVPFSNTSPNQLRWAASMPDNWNGDEDCVELLASGTFNDLSCKSTKTFLVEYDCPGVLIPSQQGCTRK